MSILIDEKMSVVIQGITGREGSARALLMKEYGTHVVAGVTPGKRGGPSMGSLFMTRLRRPMKKEALWM